MRDTDRHIEEGNRPTDQRRGFEHRRSRPREDEWRGRPRSHFPEQRPILSPTRAPEPDFALDMDILERDDEFVLSAAVPGFRPGEIDVTLVDDVIQIEASHEEADEQEEGRYIARERRRSMSRSVALGTPIAEDEEISGSYENGVVTIRLPKVEPVEDSSVRQIDIE